MGTTEGGQGAVLGVGSSLGRREGVLLFHGLQKCLCVA